MCAPRQYSLKCRKPQPKMMMYSVGGSSKSVHRVAPCVSQTFLSSPDNNRIQLALLSMGTPFSAFRTSFLLLVYSYCSLHMRHDGTVSYGTKTPFQHFRFRILPFRSTRQMSQDPPMGNHENIAFWAIPYPFIQMLHAFLKDLFGFAWHRIRLALSVGAPFFAFWVLIGIPPLLSISIGWTFGKVNTGEFLGQRGGRSSSIRSRIDAFTKQWNGQYWNALVFNVMFQFRLGAVLVGF
jgi:hypothetical protein